MAQFTPIPFGALVTRMFRELETRQRIFDLPALAVVRPEPGLDWSVTFHGRTVATPFGPAAGPHSQLAQNIVLSWLAGGRIIELKTVQVNDRIAVARPCIDMRTVGFNVEWSQELTLEQSLEEYVKASMLIEILAASGWLGEVLTDVIVPPPPPGFVSAYRKVRTIGLLIVTCLVPTEGNPEVGRPKRLDLHQMLFYFLHFRLGVVTKRLEHEHPTVPRLAQPRRMRDAKV